MILSWNPFSFIRPLSPQTIFIVMPTQHTHCLSYTHRQNVAARQQMCRNFVAKEKAGTSINDIPAFRLLTTND